LRFTRKNIFEFKLEVTILRESDKIKEKAAEKQDLENTLSFYNDAMTKKVVGQLFDEYVKEGEDLYFTRDIEKKRLNSNYDNNDYDNYNDYDDSEYEDYDDSEYEDYDDSEYEDYDVSSNTIENNSYYFGDTFNNFSKEDLLPSYNNHKSNSNNDNNFEQNVEELTLDEDSDKKIDYYDETKPPKNKKEYYEYDDFDDDFDQYDYEPKKKAKKIKPLKQKKRKKKNYDDDYEEYEDVLDKYNRKNNSHINNNHKKTQSYNIIIKDLSATKEKKNTTSYNKNLPPLKNKYTQQKELNYEDVIRYSPRRRGGRNQTVKKKKRVPLSKNKNLYTNNDSEYKSKRKNQTQKSQIIIHGSNIKKKRVRINKFLLFLVFILTVSLIFCIIRINSLKTEINSLKSAKTNYKSEIIIAKRIQPPTTISKNY